MSEDVKVYPHDPDHIFEKLKAAVRKTTFTVDKIDETDRRLILSTDWSAFSFGEIVEIGVSSDKKGSRVHVTSRPKVWHNIGAKSNAERNVKEIFKVLDENL